MQALVKTGPGAGGVGLLDWPEPAATGPDEVLIQNEWVGICGTDLGIAGGTVEHMTPVVLGHELAGAVVEVGGRVTDFRVGDRVTAETSAVTCGVCQNCREGDYNVCRERLGMGRTFHGAFRQRICLDQRLLHKLPAGLPTREAALCEPAAVAYHAVNRRGVVRPSEKVYVFGPGPIGILTAQCAVAAGARVTVVGLPADGEKLALCARFGCRTVTLAPDQAPEVPGDVDVVFECSGSAASARNGLGLLRPGGRFVQVGLFGGDPELPMNLVAARELQISGCYSAVGADFAAVLGLLEQGRLDLGCLISGEYPLEQWESAFAAAEDSKSIKIVIHP